MMHRIRISCVLVTVMLLTLLLPAAAFAEDVVSVEITVGVKYGGTAVIEPTDGAPAPSASKLNLQDGEVGTFHIDFTQVGTYAYQISQEAGTQDLTYDTSVYDMQVYVTSEGEGLGATVNVYNRSTGKKVNSRVSGGEWTSTDQQSALYFTNSAPPTSPTNPTSPAAPTSTVTSTPMTGSQVMEHYLLIAVVASAGLLLLAIVYTVSTNRLMGR